MAASLSGAPNNDKTASESKPEDAISIDDLSAGDVNLEDFVAKEEDDTSIDELTNAVDSASQSSEALDFVSEKPQETDSLI